MNYLFVHSAREWSGTARAFASAARGVALRGHQVTFAAEPDSTVEQTVSEAASSGSSGGRALVEVVPLETHRSWFDASRQLKRLARRRHSDVVLIHTDREHLIAAAAYRLGSRARVIRRIPAGNGLEMHRTGRIAARLAPTCYLFASEADLNAAPIPAGGTGRIVARLGVPEVPAQTAADLTGGEVDIVCIHDASSRSRAATAIRTLAMLAPRHPRLRLVIVGEGAYDDDLRMQAAALGALKLVTFLGDRADQLQIMRKARIGWVVADGDTAAYGILDFMALGVPVLASERSVPEGYILPDITGMVLPPDDAFSTAAVAAELLTSDTRRDTMGAAARSRVIREFPEPEMIDGFERAAAAATSRKRRR